MNLLFCLLGWDLTNMGSQCSSHGLYNTMIDAYQKAIEKLKVETEDNYEGDIFEQTKVNISTVEGLYRTAIKVHDHTLVIFFHAIKKERKILVISPAFLLSLK